MKPTMPAINPGRTVSSTRSTAPARRRTMTVVTTLILGGRAEGASGMAGGVCKPGGGLDRRLAGRNERLALERLQVLQLGQQPKFVRLGRVGCGNLLVEPEHFSVEGLVAQPHEHVGHFAPRVEDRPRIGEGVGE